MMAEKGETKILAIVTILIILISIGFSGCIGDDDNSRNNNNNIKYKEKDDLLFFIHSDISVINSSSPSLNLSFILKNLSNNSIRIFSWFDIDTTISIQLSDNVKNYTFGNIHKYLMEVNYTFIKPYETMNYTVNINNITLLNLSNNIENSFNYDKPGNYTLIAYYNFKDFKPWLKSNELQIEII
jgi:hypothetical protein